MIDNNKKKKKIKWSHSRESSSELLDHMSTKGKEERSLYNRSHSHIYNAGLVFNGAANKELNGDINDSKNLFSSRWPSSPCFLSSSQQPIETVAGRKLSNQRPVENKNLARKRLSLENIVCKNGTCNEKITKGKSRTMEYNDHYESRYNVLNRVGSFNPYKIMDMDGLWKDWDPNKSE